MRLMATIVSGSVSHNEAVQLGMYEVNRFYSISQHYPYNEALQLGMYEVNGYHSVRQC